MKEQRFIPIKDSKILITTRKPNVNLSDSPCEIQVNIHIGDVNENGFKNNNAL